MNKSDLKVGYVIKTRNNLYGIIMEARNNEICCYFESENGFIDIYEDLCSKSNKDYDIIEVYGFTDKYQVLEINPIKSKRELLWKREPDPKVMTLNEVEKELGYKIKLKEEATWNSPFNPPSNRRNVIVKMKEEEVCYTGYYSYVVETWHVWINEEDVELEKDMFNSIYGWIDEPNGLEN